MSAFICNDNHINAIVRWASEHDVYTLAGREQEVAQLLLTENIRSVNHRYFDDLTDENTVIKYDPRATSLRPIEVLKAVHCLEYQSCEHDGWETSLAHTVLRRIESKATSLLPGYDKAAWEIKEKFVGVAA